MLMKDFVIDLAKFQACSFDSVWENDAQMSVFQ